MNTERQELDLKGIFFNIGNKTDFSTYEMIYQQTQNELCRFPELLPMFQHGYSIEYLEAHGFLRVSAGEDLPIILQCLYDAFSESPKLAIYVEEATNTVCVAQTKRYQYEPFEMMRNRNLFIVRDMLGISHEGKGKDSIRLELKDCT